MEPVTNFVVVEGNDGLVEKNKSVSDLETALKDPTEFSARQREIIFQKNDESVKERHERINSEHGNKITAMIKELDNLEEMVMLDDEETLKPVLEQKMCEHLKGLFCFLVFCFLVFCFFSVQKNSKIILCRSMSSPMSLGSPEWKSM